MTVGQYIVGIEYEPHNNFFLCGDEYLRPQDILDWTICEQKISRGFRLIQVMPPWRKARDFKEGRLHPERESLFLAYCQGAVTRAKMTKRRKVKKTKHEQCRR